jgi:hypothetical protein
MLTKKNIYDIASEVVRRHQYTMIRPVKDEAGLYFVNDEDANLPTEDEETAFVQPESQKGFMILDAQTAQAIKLVYENLKPENQEKFLTLPLPTLVNFCWRMVR